MRWFFVVFVAWMSLELSGLRAVVAGECDACCLEEFDESAGCEPCACCASVRSEELSIAAALPIPIERRAAVLELFFPRLEPDPREIVHVPIFAA